MYRAPTYRSCLAVVALSTFIAFPSAASAQLIGGGGPGSRLSRLREKRSNKDASIHYDPAVVTAGTSRERVISAFGEPNATQGEGAAREDVYAFRPDGSKFVDPQMSAGTIAAAVFTGGMSLAVRKARTTVQESQLTLYRIHYDAQDRITSVQVVPPKLATPAPASPGGAR